MTKDRKKTPLQMIDIAPGVSKSTVSRALSDSPLVAMDGGKPGFITLDPELVVGKSSRRQA